MAALALLLGGGPRLWEKITRSRFGVVLGYWAHVADPKRVAALAGCAAVTRGMRSGRQRAVAWSWGPATCLLAFICCVSGTRVVPAFRYV